jgi:hypothetical protein
MKAEALAELRRIMRGETVTSQVATVTPETPRVTPATPVTPKNDGRGNENEENATADAGALLDTIEERAGLAADRVPVAYLDVWARLNHQRPFDVSEAEWRLALDDGGRFLDAWGGEAAEAGWTPGELFDVMAGLVWRLAGEQVDAIGVDRVRLNDGRTIMRRTLPKAN